MASASTKCAKSVVNHNPTKVVFKPLMPLAINITNYNYPKHLANAKSYDLSKPTRRKP